MRGVPPDHTKFKKGQSGNPKGRPRKLPQLDTLLAEVLGDEKRGKSAAEVILQAIRRKAEKGDVRAAELILNRAYGKPKESVDLTSKGESVVPFNDNQVDKIIHELRKSKGKVKAG